MRFWVISAALYSSMYSSLVIRLSCIAFRVRTATAMTYTWAFSNKISNNQQSNICSMMLTESKSTQVKIDANISVNFIGIQISCVAGVVIVICDSLCSLYKVWMQESFEVRSVLPNELFFLSLQYFYLPHLHQPFLLGFPLLLLLRCPILLQFYLPQSFNFLDMLFHFLSLSLHGHLLYSFLLGQFLQQFDSELFLEIFFLLFLSFLHLNLLIQRSDEHCLEHFPFLLFFLFFSHLIGLALELIVLQPHFFQIFLLFLPFQLDFSHFLIYCLSLFLFLFILQLLISIPVVKLLLVSLYLLKFLLVFLLLLGSYQLFQSKLLKHRFIQFLLFLFFSPSGLLFGFNHLVHLVIHHLLLFQVLLISLLLQLFSLLNLVRQIFQILSLLLLHFLLHLLSSLLFDDGSFDHLGFDFGLQCPVFQFHHLFLGELPCSSFIYIRYLYFLLNILQLRIGFFHSLYLEFFLRILQLQFPQLLGQLSVVDTKSAMHVSVIEEILYNILKFNRNNVLVISIGFGLFVLFQSLPSVILAVGCIRGVFVALMELECLFAEDCHPDYQNISDVRDYHWDVQHSREKYVYLLPGHQLEAHAVHPQEIVYQEQLQIFQLMSPLSQPWRLFLYPVQLLRNLQNQGPMEKCEEISGVKAMPKSTYGQSLLLSLNLQFFLLLGGIVRGRFIDPVIDVSFQGSLNRDIPPVRLFLHAGVHFKIPNV